MTFDPTLWAGEGLKAQRSSAVLGIIASSEARRWERLQTERPRAWRRAVRWKSLRRWCRRHGLPIPRFARVTLPPDPQLEGRDTIIIRRSAS